MERRRLAARRREQEVRLDSHADIISSRPVLGQGFTYVGVAELVDAPA